MRQCWSCSWCRWWHYPALPGCAGSCSSTAVAQLEWKNSQRCVLIICLMTQLSEQCFGSRAEGITDLLLLPDAWHSLRCAGAGAGHIPGIWVGRRLLILEKRWMELRVLCQRSSDGQLFLPVCKYRSQAVQDILDNEAQFICCSNRVSEKLLSLPRKQSLSKGRNKGCLPNMTKLEPTHVGLKDTYSQELETGDWVLILG